MKFFKTISIKDMDLKNSIPLSPVLIKSMIYVKILSTTSSKEET
jgi:hypothetical protein